MTGVSKGIPPNETVSKSRNAVGQEEGSLDFDQGFVYLGLARGAPPVAGAECGITTLTFGQTGKSTGLKTQEGCYDVALTCARRLLTTLFVLSEFRMSRMCSMNSCSELRDATFIWTGYSLSSWLMSNSLYS